MANGICGRASTVVNNKIIQLANEGMTTQQIADVVGLKQGAVGSRMKRLIDEGRLKRFSERTGSVDTPKGRYDILKGRYGRRTGGMMDLLMQLPMEQAEWLCQTMADDMTIAEWCAVLLRDVIADEIEAEKQND
jgi:predicted ArsR family transcriptional regulator